MENQAIASLKHIFLKGDELYWDEDGITHNRRITITARQIIADNISKACIVKIRADVLEKFLDAFPVLFDDKEIEIIEK